jgi:UPF0755 protein
MRVIKFVFLLALAAVAWTVWFAFTPVSLSAATVDFSILPGSGLRAAIRQIRDAGVDIRAWQFNAIARVTKSDTGIKAGSYEISEGTTPWQLLRKITSGDFTQAEVTFIEGWTFRQMRSALDSHPDVRHEIGSLGDLELMERLGSPGVRPEGWFFPDTYLFAKGTPDTAILLRAHRAMQRRLEAAWNARATDSPLRSPYEALILASIVEKETGSPDDRARIAGVFINRMRVGMKLQTDPTVIYGLGERFDGNLRKRDLLTDTPFNTYTRDGLPPAPIAMPGTAALQATLHPASTDALYFVAKGDGSSQFSRTLDEHNRAVARYQKPARASR